VESNDKLDSADNALVDPADIHPFFEQFVKFSVMDANITRGKVTKIPVDAFESLSRQIEELESELKENQEAQAKEQDNLALQIEIAERERKEQQEEDEKQHQKELEKLKRDIWETEQKVTKAKHDADVEALNQQIEGLKSIQAQHEQMMSQERQFMAERQATESPWKNIFSGLVTTAKTFITAKYLGPAAAAGALLE